MFKNLDKKLKDYSFGLIILSIFLCLAFSVLLFYNMLNAGSLNIVSTNGSIVSIPYWVFIVAIIILTLYTIVILMLVYGVGEALQKLTNMENTIKDSGISFEKEQISKFVEQPEQPETKVTDVVVEETKQEEQKPEVVATDKVEEQPQVNVSEEPTQSTSVIETHAVEQVAEEVNEEAKIFEDVEDTLDNTVEIENKTILDSIKEKPNYRLELSNAFFTKLKPIKLTTVQERAAYENVETALLTKEDLQLVTTTLENKKVRVTLPIDTLGHVTDNMEAYKDALKIFRNLKSIQVVKDFEWKI